MLVVKEKQKLLMNLRNPEQVLALIPDAKMQVIKERNIVSVPHDDEVVRVLRNLGLAAPGPIRSYYDWPCRPGRDPFLHQLETAEFLTMNPRAFCLNGMGSGKTLAVLWALHWLREQGIIQRAVVTSPLSTLERTWGDEIFSTFPDLSFGIIHGPPRRKRIVAADNYDIFIINHDGVKDESVLSCLAERNDVNAVVVDELACFRNASTEKWKAINRLINGDKKRGWAPKPFAWGLTGTPIPKEPTDAWGQCKLIRPDSVPKFFGAFRDTVMKPIAPYKWAPRDNALDHVSKVMQPAIRFSREDCIDLPPTTYVTREVEMTPEQKRLYKELMSRFKTEFEGGSIKAVNEAVRIGKLLQVVCGVAYTEDGDVQIPSETRVAEVFDIVENAEGKVIVFVPLTGALRGLAAALGEQYEVAIVDGSTSKTARDNIFSAFMSKHGPRVLVAQPGTMSHGLTLTEANTIVWYAPVHSNEIYEQANARIVRPGQKRNTLIVRLQGSDLERRIYERLEKRGDMQGLLLGMFEQPADALTETPSKA